MKQFNWIALLAISACMMWCNACTKDYVDLGLPSGTKWKMQNEEGFHAYRDAKYGFGGFGRKVPDRDQWVELMSECSWEWAGTGYTITGPNGNSIFLPAAGEKDLNDSISEIGTYGNYWSSTDEGIENSYYIFFYPDGKSTSICSPYYEMSVRLVR